MKDKIYIADAIRGVFGINSPVFIPYSKGTSYKAERYSNIQMLGENSGDFEMSEFGTPIFGTVSFEAGEYNTYNRLTGEIEKITMTDYTLPYSCIVDFSRDANVTKTEVLGSTGTVKEIYGKGDWTINIRGIAFNNRDGSGATAQEQINALVKWEVICDSIPIVGGIFREKGINNIVIESLSVHPVVGKWNEIPFQIEAVSDEPIELYLL